MRIHHYITMALLPIILFIMACEDAEISSGKVRLSQNTNTDYGEGSGFLYLPVHPRKSGYAEIDFDVEAGVDYRKIFIAGRTESTYEGENLGCAIIDDPDYGIGVFVGDLENESFFREDLDDLMTPGSHTMGCEFLDELGYVTVSLYYDKVKIATRVYSDEDISDYYLSRGRFGFGGFSTSDKIGIKKFRFYQQRPTDGFSVDTGYSPPPDN